jgi:hypothetical protein
MFYAAYYDNNGYKILEFDAKKARRIGGYISYNGWIYGPANEVFTDREGARLWIIKEYGAARKYQVTLEQAQKAEAV